jgi:hypothetical protein
MEATGDGWLLATLKVDVVNLEHASPAFSADTGQLVSAVEDLSLGRIHTEAIMREGAQGRSSDGSPPAAVVYHSSDAGEPAYSHHGLSQAFNSSSKSSSISSYESKSSGRKDGLPDRALWSAGDRKIWSARRQSVPARSSLVESEG